MTTKQLLEFKPLHTNIYSHRPVNSKYDFRIGVGIKILSAYIVDLRTDLNMVKYDKYYDLETGGQL